MKNRRLHKCLICFVALTLCLSFWVVGSYAASPDSPAIEQVKELTPAEKEIADFKSEVIRLVNVEREKSKIIPLSTTDTLSEASDLRARECNENFSHTRPDNCRWITVYDQYSLKYRAAGENLAYGFKTPEAVVKAWMNSSGHKANIMDPDFVHIGIGFYRNENGRIYCTQLFYTPRQ